MPGLQISDIFRVILAEADVAARRLLRRLSLDRHYLEDIRQDLLLDMCRRQQAFDPNRGSIGAFAGRLMANRASRLAARIHRHRTVFASVSLDEPLPVANGATLGDTFAAGAGYLTIAEPSDAFVPIHRRLDLERALGSLPEVSSALCAELIHRTPTELCARGLISRSALYRRLHEIRLQMTSQGLSVVEWDGPMAPRVGATMTNRKSNTMLEPKTEQEFCSWLGQASNGDTLEYFRGSLVNETHREVSRLPPNDCQELGRLAKRARWAAERGLVHLLQRRNGPDDFTYLVVARSRPRPLSAGLSSLSAALGRD